MKRSWVSYALIVIVVSSCGARTETIPAPNSVSRLLSVDIGGMNQWILIRGENRNNPVLLWLHGGPGSAQMPIHHAYTKELEKEFVIVHWDQRGAGKSNNSEFREESMTMKRFIEDAHELTTYLKNQFDRQKIYLLGHSWGTLLGINVVRRYPGDYHAFVSISQVVDPVKADSISWNWLQKQVAENRSRNEESELDELGGPPFDDHDRFVEFIQMVDAYGGGMDASFIQLLWKALGAGEYTLADYVRWFEGANRGSGPMWEEIRNINLFSSIDTLQTPVYFFTGRKDFNTPSQLVQQYYEFLKAPSGKHLVIFNESAHTPFIAETRKFNREVIRVKRQLEE